jgi:hypothetical protein
VLLRWLLYLALIAAPAASWNGEFPLDDAYITMHNARALLSGWDTTYDVSPLTGATSLVHLLLVAGIGLVLPMPAASLVVSLLGSVAYAAAIDRLSDFLKGWQRPAVVASGLAIGTVPQFLVNGLETSLAMATVGWLLVLRDDKRLFVLAGICPFVRPEIAILGAALVLRQLWRAGWHERAKGLGLSAAVAAPFVAWSFVETGHVVPGTMAAKLAFFRSEDIVLIARLGAPLVSMAEYGLGPLLFGLLGLRSWPSWVFLGTVVGTGMVLMPWAFDWNEGRYFGPLLPPLVMGLANSGRPALIAFVAAWTAIWFPSQVAQLHEKRAWYSVERAQLAGALGQLPDGSVVLVHDAGMAAWVAPQLRLVDVVGLKTLSSVAAHERLTRRTCAWGPAIDQIARQSGARHAIVLQEPFWRCVGKNLRQAGWRMCPISSGEYQLFEIEPAKARPTSLKTRDRSRSPECDREAHPAESPRVTPR